jgi:hypothetical protein
VQDVSDEYLNALTGSLIPTVTADAWYDGALVLANVPLTSGSVTVDGSRTIAGSATVVAAKEDDSLVPQRWDAPLAPYGSQIQVRAGVKFGSTTEQVSLGWFRIDTADPQEWWVKYQKNPAKDPEWVCRGMQVQVEASDRMSVLEDARFLAPEAPASTASVLDEIRRLARDLVPIADWTGKVDGPIPAAVAYQTSRVQAIQDLADVLGYAARFNPNGALDLRDKAPSSTSVWTVSIDEGDIVSWGGKLDRSDLYNGVISTGQGPDGVPTQGAQVESSGPLRWDGPMGRIPFGHSSPLLITNDAAQADAETLLDRLIRERVAPVTVTCTANPALEWGDTVTLKLPRKTLRGTVKSITWPLPAKTMTMTVMVPRTQIWGL